MAALVIGNANYLNGGALGDRVNDAIDVAAQAQVLATTRIKDAYRVDAVCVGGADVLRVRSSGWSAQHCSAISRP
jgi:hypothetical protein